jgi:hypothetical protein
MTFPTNYSIIFVKKNFDRINISKIVLYLLQMKNIKSRFLLIFLANLILFNSFGFGLVEHSCSMRGKKTYSFISKETCKGCGKHCNSKKGKTTISRSKCCDDKKLEKQQSSESIVTITSKALKSVGDIFAKSVLQVSKFLFNTILNIVGNHTHNNYTNSFSGKSLLIFISVLRL